MGKWIDLTGKRFNRLVAKRYIGINKNLHTVWLWECDCGNEKEIVSYAVKNGHIKSCGCYGDECRIKYGTVHGGVGTKLYATWCNMKGRCNNSNYRAYRWYGKRGINICKEWYDFNNFRDWAINNGYDEKLSIDRINSNGNYEPSNCRWTTMTEQGKNKRKRISKYIYKINGETKTLKEWAKEYNINYTTLFYRYKNGKDLFKITCYHKKGFLTHTLTKLAESGIMQENGWCL